jgi:hypothetical protein
LTQTEAQRELFLGETEFEPTVLDGNSESLATDRSSLGCQSLPSSETFQVVNDRSLGTCNQSGDVYTT